MEIVERISNIEKELQYFLKGGVWQPYRYRIFVERIEHAIEFLKKINEGFCKNKMTPEEEAIGVSAKILLQQYLALWENDFN